MDGQELFKHFALYGILASWLLGAWLSFRTKNEDKKTTSGLATTNRTNYFIFGLALTVGAVSLALCAFGYLKKYTDLPGIFYNLLVFCLILQLVTAWVSDTKGWKHTVHYFAAWVMSYLLLSLGGILLASTGSTWLQASGLVLLVAMAFAGTYAGRPGGTNKQFLRSQQLYFVLFQLLLLAWIYAS